MHKILSLFIFSSIFVLCFSFIANAQSDYIISNEGDTLYGKIRNQGEILNSNSITILDYKTNNWRTFYPKQIDSYLIKGFGVYKSFRALNNSEEQFLFFKEIVHGQVKLYSITKKLDEANSSNLNYLGEVLYEFFFIEDDELFSLTPENESNDLKEILYKCRDSSFLKKLNDKNISKNELSNIIVEYNLCINPNSTSEITDQSLMPNNNNYSSSFGIKTSFNSTNFLYSEIDAVNDKFDYSNYTYVGIGAFYSGTMSKNFSFTVEFNYEEKGYSDETVIVVSEFYENEGEEILLRSYGHLKMIQVPLFASYIKNFNKFSVNIDLGASIGFVLNDEFEFEDTKFVTESGKDYLTLRDVPFVHQVPSRLENSFLTGIGLTYDFGAFNLSMGTRFRIGRLNVQTSENSTLSTYIGIGFNR